MITESYRIVGGNFERAGLASLRLKDRLKRIGVDSKLIRRIMIAAYEAEMNVVIHANSGNMWVRLDRGLIEIEVKDEGPGIPDIDQAMQEGFSTASPVARALGFGAGMGLPNIKRSSDIFKIETSVGQGTSIRSTIYLQLQDLHGSTRNSLSVKSELCNECLRCLHACPTGALRLRDGGPIILQHLCIDCTSCIDVCRTGALVVNYANNTISQPGNTSIVVPTAFFSQCGPDVSLHRVYEILMELGFRDVHPRGEWESALQKAVIQYANEEANVKPVISPVCPSVINLIETRFPSLIENLAPFLSPLQAALSVLDPKNTVVVAECPSQRSALLSRCTSAVEVMTPLALLQIVLPLLMRNAGKDNEKNRASPPSGRIIQPPSEVLQVSGIRSVMQILEKVENGLLCDVPVLEPYACGEGCFGSPLLLENPFYARYRSAPVHIDHYTLAKAVRRTYPFYPREGLRLDTDMTAAMKKLSKISELTRIFPGKDCGRCGAPTCSSLAEDIVMGRATREACIYLDCEKDGRR
jgi:anti-sigma regulatory factor (Ser/Thr protein kinase)/formate hydrogenlyase subunit 6/NADH:ubiquinone oxidoreductase subunit I